MAGCQGVYVSAWWRLAETSSIAPRSSLIAFTHPCIMCVCSVPRYSPVVQTDTSGGRRLAERSDGSERDHIPGLPPSVEGHVQTGLRESGNSRSALVFSNK